MSCTHVQSGSVVKVDDGKQFAIFNNKKREDFLCTLVDGCKIDDDGLRSDWLVQGPCGRQIVVELKGGDVEHAVKQIARTLTVGLTGGWIVKPVGVLVVASKVRPAARTTMQVAIARHKKDFSAVMRVSTDPTFLRSVDEFF